MDLRNRQLEAAYALLATVALLASSGCGGGTTTSAVQANSPVREARPWVLTF